ncbi:MAG: PD-(D/E)XK nuclease family protein [Burkholderiales bacterium]|nr:PD-(D/E)XK nuclease family protein [Burkholderiales bacterium]MBK8667860.1 PD-(D/E)XK nuclease family protein [Burkholderiales bacterium]
MNAVTSQEVAALGTTFIRASSLPEMFDCPSRWHAKQILGLRTPMSGKAALGKAIHASTGAFDAARVLGSPITADDAAGAAVDALHRPDEDVDWEDDSPQKAESIALALHGKYCAEIAPTQDYAAVEAKCEALTISDLGITLTGTIDRVYRDDTGALGIADIKTGKTAVSAAGEVKTQGHGLQLATYELLAETAIQQPITAPARVVGMQTGVTAKAQRIALGEIDSPRDALIGDQDQPGALQHAAAMLKSGMFYPNPRSMLCGERFCPIWHTCNARK